jgi:hypothetical protein
MTRRGFVPTSERSKLTLLPFRLGPEPPAGRVRSEVISTLTSAPDAKAPGIAMDRPAKRAAAMLAARW